jgi:uncharacterized surface protein with fasciclin (FAS1) repeats
MKKTFLKLAVIVAVSTLPFTACKKQNNIEDQPTQTEEDALKASADKAVSEKQKSASDFEKAYGQMLEVSEADNGKHNRNIVEVAQSVPIFKSLVAAVIKTNLVGALSSESLKATVFAPTDDAFAKLPAPFNNPTNITGITDPAQIAALKNILLYHVLGTKVKFNQINAGRSSATTLNTKNIYFSKNFQILIVNGNSLVQLANVKASNGVIHVIDDVLIPADKTIAEIAVGNPAFSTLVAALAKTNLVTPFTGAGNFTVFAPTNDAFAQLPAPFNNATSITAISDPVQIAALTNILKYHVTTTRYFAWDFGIFQPITTIASAPNNKVTGILGFNSGAIKGNNNTSFSVANPANILATNGVVHVLNKVLLP